MNDMNKTEDQLIDELAKMRQRITQLETLEAKHKHAEKAVQVSHRLLEIANRHMEMTPLLKEFVLEVKTFTQCAAVGLRILDQDGNIPYQAYQGFSQKFYESESALSIKSDQCMCINVIRGAADPKLPYHTEGGSFYMNGTTRFLATVSEEEKGATRNVCNEFGYESVALIPIRIEEHILGLIHVADPRENVVPLKVVKTLEDVAMQLGMAMRRVYAEEALRISHDELEKRIEERTRELAISNEELRSQIRRRRKGEDQIKASLEEKEVLLREIHHRAKNNLQIISSLLNLQSRYIKDKQVLHVFKESRDRIRSMTLVHEKLYQSRELGRIDFAEYVRSLAASLFHSYQVNSDLVTLKTNIDGAFLDIETAIPCGLIVHELVSNSLKYAFLEGRQGKVHIDLHSDKESKLTLVIGDNGVGFPKDLDFRNRKSLGLRLVCILVDQLRGSIELDRSSGTEFKITFTELNKKGG